LSGPPATPLSGPEVDSQVIPPQLQAASLDQNRSRYMLKTSPTTSRPYGPYARNFRRSPTTYRSATFRRGCRGESRAASASRATPLNRSCRRLPERCPTGYVGGSLYGCRGNMTHIRQSSPDSGLGFQVKILKPFQVAPYSLESKPGLLL